MLPGKGTTRYGGHHSCCSLLMAETFLPRSKKEY